MSSIRHSLSFITTTKNNLAKQDIAKHQWMFSMHDLAALHMDDKRFGLLAEMGGVQGLAGALRTDLHSGLFADEVVDDSFQQRAHKYAALLFLCDCASTHNLFQHFQVRDQYLPYQAHEKFPDVRV